MSNRRESEEEDNPEPFGDSSGDEWNAEAEEAGRRKSSRLSTKPKRKFVDSGEESPNEEDVDEDDDFDSEEEKPKRRKLNNKSNGRNAAKKPTKPKGKPEAADSEEDEIDEEEEEEEDDEFTDDSNNSSTIVAGSEKSNQRKFLPKTIHSEDYATGSFVIAKKDAKNLEKNSKPCIWRIDGKALLQKYEPLEQDGKVLHKNTSIYTGWSTIDKDIYAPVTVDVIKHSNSNLTVELHWDKVKATDSD